MPMILPIIAIGVAAAVGTTTAFVIGTVVAVGLTMVLSKKTSGVSSQAFAGNPEGSVLKTNPQQLTFSNDAPRRLVYGSSRVSGIVPYANVSGEGYEYLYMVVVIAAHKITNVGTMYFDNEPAEDVASGFYEMWWHDGTQVTADDRLMAAFPQDWKSDCILKGCAYAVVKLTFDKSVFKNGRPNIQFDIRGKPVYDPRDGTEKFTCNAALIINDFLRSPDGLNATLEEVNQEDVKASADICDQIPNGMSASLCDTRYTVSGVIELATSNGDIISNLLAACSGTVVWTEGQYRLYVGAGRLPVARPITAEDIREAPTVQPNAPSEQSFNCIKGSFMDSTNGWVMNDFPPVVGQEYIDQDGGIQTFKDIVLPYTTSPLSAQRLANIYLRRARMEGIVTLPCKWTCFNYEVWDVIELKLPQFGWISKQFQITDWKMIPPDQKNPGGIDLQLQEYNFDAFSDDMNLKPLTPGGVVTVPDVTLAKPLPVLYATSDITSIKADGTPQVRFDWPMSADIHCVAYELAFGKVPYTPADSDFVVLPAASLITYSTDRFEAGDTVIGYIRTLNTYRKRSGLTASNIVTVAGIPGQFPENVRGFSVMPVDDEYVDLVWSTPMSKVKSTEIRFSTTDDFDDSVPVAIVLQPQNSVRVRRQTVAGTYFASFISMTGEFSLLAASDTDTARPSAWDVMYASLSVYKGKATNAVWRTPYKLVPDSTVGADTVNWEVFDVMVPMPYTDPSYWSANSFRTTSNSALDVSGTVGINRAPGVPGALPIKPAQALITYDSGDTLIKQGEFTTGEGSSVQIGFQYNLTDQQGVIFNGANLALGIGGRGRTPFALDVSRNSWGDVVFSWLAQGFDPATERYIVDIYEPENGITVMTSIEVGASNPDDTGRIFADWANEQNIPFAVLHMGGQYPWSTLIWRVRIKGTSLSTDVMTTTVIVDNPRIVKVAILCGINSLIGGMFNDLSDPSDEGGTGKEGRKDLVAASTLRLTFAQKKGLRPCQVIPVMIVVGSSPINPMPYQPGFDLNNYWWDSPNKRPGPNLTIADGIVKNLGVPPSYFIQSGPGESTGIAYAPEADRPAILAAWRKSNIEMLTWMRENWGNAALECWFQGATTSWWGDPPPLEVNYEGAKLLRDLATSMARNVPGFKVCSYVTNANRWESFRNEMADGIGWVHYTLDVYHSTAVEDATNMADNRNIAFDTPPWVDFEQPTNMRTYRRSNGDVVFEWDGRAGKTFDFKNLNIDPALPGVVIKQFLTTDKLYVWPLAEQQATYPGQAAEGVAWVDWMVAEIDTVANDTGPANRYSGPVTIVDPSLPAPTNLKARWAGAQYGSDIIYSWDPSPIGGGFRITNYNLNVYLEILQQEVVTTNTWTYTKAQQDIDYGFSPGYVMFEVQAYNASTGTTGAAVMFNDAPTV